MNYLLNSFHINKYPFTLLFVIFIFSIFYILKSNAVFLLKNDTSFFLFIIVQRNYQRNARSLSLRKLRLLSSKNMMDMLEDGLRFKIYNECGFIPNLLVTSKETYQYCIESEEYKMEKAEKDCVDLFNLMSNKFTEIHYYKYDKNPIQRQNIQKISKKISNLVKKSNSYWNIILLEYIHDQYNETNYYDGLSCAGDFVNDKVGEELLKILKNINTYYQQDILDHLNLDDEKKEFYKEFVEHFSHK
tara:strand:- start:2600 stop:3334 length:735 start_codon:yes stop_codon:yes gene_type:complete